MLVMACKLAYESFAKDLCLDGLKRVPHCAVCCVLNRHRKQQPQKAFSTDVVPGSISRNGMIFHEDCQPMVDIGVGLRQVVR